MTADSRTPGEVDPATGHAWNGLRWIAQDQPAAPSPVDTTQPPAETQQDEEPCCTIDGGGRCNDCPALAARPSADTETLRDALRRIDQIIGNDLTISADALGEVRGIVLDTLNAAAQLDRLRGGDR